MVRQLVVRQDYVSKLAECSISWLPGKKVPLIDLCPGLFHLTYKAWDRRSIPDRLLIQRIPLAFDLPLPQSSE